MFTQTCKLAECGVARTKRRIVGGYETKEREYPWMAMLMYNGRFFCGASLINDLYVLTAAHCSGYVPIMLQLVQKSKDKRHLLVCPFGPNPIYNVFIINMLNTTMMHNRYTIHYQLPQIVSIFYFICHILVPTF